MEEAQTPPEETMAAPAIFVLVFSFQFAALYLESYIKMKTVGGVEAKLRAEVNQLLKEASTLTQPSTFAQAAKLRRTAAAKEKELAKYQEMNKKYVKVSYNKYGKPLKMLKVLTYVSLVILFWRAPVTMISSHLVQPLGKILSWRSGASMKDNVMVGIIPWLIISTRVSKFVCRKVFDVKHILKENEKQAISSSMELPICREHHFQHMSSWKTMC